MERSKLWSRVGDWIRHPRRSLGWDVTEISETQIAQPYRAVEGDDAPADNGHNRRQWLSFGGSRKAMEEQSRQVTELVQSLQLHAQRQTDAAETANANLERLIATLSAIPNVLQSQQRALQEIHAKLDHQAGGQKQVQEVLNQLGGIRDAVRESSVAFLRYTEATQKSSDAVASELQKQGQAVAQIAQSADPMMRAISALRSDVGSRGEELAQCVTTLNTKLMQFASAALILALIAAIIGVVAFFR